MIFNWIQWEFNVNVRSSNQNLYNAKFDYSQPMKFSDEGKSFGALYEELLFWCKEYGNH
jgi:hypothetical protein